MSDSASTKPKSSGRRSLIRQLIRIRRPFIALLVIAILEGIIAWIDYSRGDQVPAGYFYVLPVIIGGFHLGYYGGVGVPVLSILLFHLFGKVFQHRGYMEADILWLLLLVVLGTIIADSQAARRRERQHSRQLERLSRAREELTALIVHDLRTPLAGILNVLRIVSEGDRATLPPEQAQLLAVALATGEDMAGMINDLLNLHAMESGALRLQPAKLHAAEIITAAVRQVEPLAQQKSVALNSSASEDIPTFKADEKMLIRVLVNLLGNALRFSPSNSTIHLTIERDGMKLRFKVSDEGPGIPTHLHDKIFEKFASIDHEAGKFISTGLGLAFAKMAVEAHGGTIGVQSPCITEKDDRTAHGSCFYFTLPL